MNSFTHNFETHPFGLYLKQPNFILLFGNAKADAESIEKAFPQFRFQRIKQTHSDKVVEASDDIHEADAHFTSAKNNGLFIRTADCLPVLIYCHETGRVASVHAGWKGVVNQIVLKTLEKLCATGSSQNLFEIWIGPHILQKSFEIDLDVLKQLELATYRLKRSDYSYEENGKYYVDLGRIVASQVFEVSGPSAKVHLSDLDTKTDLNYSSFRRDKEKAGRNVSFIAALGK